MSNFGADAHKRAARMLGYTLALGDFEAWNGFTIFLTARLDPKERAALAWAVLRSLDDETAADTVSTVFGDRSAGWPKPSLYSLMQEAAQWTELASEEELGAYCLATFRAMPKRRQAAFLAFVHGRGVE